MGIRGSLVKRYADSARRRGSAAMAAAAAALAATAAGCSAGATAHSATEAKAGASRVTITPINGLHAVRPGAWVTVRASNGHLKGVEVTAAGVAVAGALSGNGTVWRSQSHLLPSTSYKVVATAV